jgi:hypothetical protein
MLRAQSMPINRCPPTQMMKGNPLKTVSFIEAMECLPLVKVRDGPEWTYEIHSCKPHSVPRRSMMEETIGHSTDA